jgi:hypothetical protein
VHGVLSESHQLGAVQVRTYVHVLPVRHAAEAGGGEWSVSYLQGSHQGCDPHVQVTSDGISLV